MNSFLTIEDVNTNNLGIINEFYTLDPSLLGNTDYNNKVYDFNKVTKTTNQDSTTTFIFEIRNSLWTGGFYVTDLNGDYIDVSESYSYDSINHKLTITTNETDIILHLYLCSLAPSEDFLVNQIEWLIKDFDEVITIENYSIGVYLEVEQLYGETITGCYSKTQIDGTSAINYIELPVDTAFTRNLQSLKYMNEDGSNSLYIATFGAKIYENITLDTEDVYLGQNNKVKINYSMNYGAVLSGYVLFNNQKYIIQGEPGDYYFNLDLRDYNRKHIELKLVLLETGMVLSSEYSFSFNVDYEMVTSESELLSLISDGGIVTIVTDLTLTDNIIINHDTRIIGNDCNIDLNEHSFILSDGVKCKLENVLLDNGDTAIIQGKNSHLELENVTFNNCVSRRYNNQGACILCDIDINSLDDANDYYTVLKNCSFLNNHNCIVHGGELTVTGCEYTNTDMEYSNKNNVAFLYQVDGNATLKGNSFNIDYYDEVLYPEDVEGEYIEYIPGVNVDVLNNNYCENQESIGFAQALVKIGETAQINNLSHKDYTDGRFNLLDDNTSHLYCKYYYPKIEACVYSSPVMGFEDRCACYSASNVNWVYKENVQITRAGTDQENTNGHNEGV